MVWIRSEVLLSADRGISPYLNVGGLSCSRFKARCSSRVPPRWVAVRVWPGPSIAAHARRRHTCHTPRWRDSADAWSACHSKAGRIRSSCWNKIRVFDRVIKPVEIRPVGLRTLEALLPSEGIDPHGHALLSLWSRRWTLASDAAAERCPFRGLTRARSLRGARRPVETTWPLIPRYSRRCRPGILPRGASPMR